MNPCSYRFREDSHLCVTFNFTEACFKESAATHCITLSEEVCLSKFPIKVLIQEGKVSISAIDDKAYKLSNMNPPVLSGKQQINWECCTEDQQSSFWSNYNSRKRLKEPHKRSDVRGWSGANICSMLLHFFNANILTFKEQMLHVTGTEVFHRGKRQSSSLKKAKWLWNGLQQIMKEQTCQICNVSIEKNKIKNNNNNKKTFAFTAALICHCCS